jgi:hypothetical protein
MSVSLILITGVLSMAQIYHSRTLNDTKKQQALYSVMSAVSLVSDNICSDVNHSQWIDMLWNSDARKPADISYTIEKLEFENADMGTVSLTFEWNTDEADKFPYTMKITAVSDYYGQEETLCAEFSFDSEYKWSFLNYCE